MPFKTNGFARFGLVMSLLLFLSFGLFAQETVTGKVIGSADKQPVPFATVQVRGEKGATQTATDGTFSIRLAKGTGTLVISAIGFEAMQVPVNGTAALGILTLKNTSSTLNDIVVTGYTAQKKKDITGAVAVVDVKSMTAVPNGATENLLQGQAAGVQVIASGNPGQGADVRIRGIGSFGDNTPLYIVDGVQADMSNINPSDIESVQVLKDAGAAAIYGVAGGNGVVIITTKRGHQGKTTISYDGFVGSTQPIGGNAFHLLNSQELLTLTKQVDVGAGTPSQLYGPNYTMPDFLYNSAAGPHSAMAGDPAVNPALYNFDASNPNNDYLIAAANKNGTDWFHQVFKPALQQSHTISASGGSERSTYFFALNYLDNQGTLINSYLKRYSARMNTVFNVKNNVRFGENAYVFYRINPPLVPGTLTGNQSEGNDISYTYREQPIIPVYDIKGNYGGTFDGPELGNGHNPVADLQRTANNKYNQWDVIGNVFAEVDFLKHFTIRTSFGGTIDNQYSYRFTYNDYNDVESHTSLNQFNEDAQYNSTTLWTNTLVYNNTFAEKHALKILVGTEAKNAYGRGVGGAGNALFVTDPAYWVLSNATQNVTNYSNAYTNKTESYFARVEYAFDDKYLIQANIRRDGYSVFGPNAQTGNFPSVSLGWRVSQEDFMKSATWINDLKLRGSYGVLGNNRTVVAANAYNVYGTNFGNSYYDINGTSTSTVQGFYATQIGNPNTTWEQDKMTNIGLDGTVLDNKIDFNLEWFDKKSNALLFPAQLDYLVGAANAPDVNIANVKNTGVDIHVGYKGRVGQDWRYGVGLNVSAYKSMVTNVGGAGYFDAGSSRIGNFTRNAVGHPLGSFFGYKVVGMFQSNKDTIGHNQQDEAPGRFIYEDADHDGAITPNDREFFGNPNPKFTYGINLTASYKAFDFTAFFNGSYGNKVINYVRYWTDFYDAFAGNKSKDLLYNSWSPSNPNAKTPAPFESTSFSTDEVPNSYFMESGSFMKLKNLTLGYTLPRSMLKMANIDKFRIYAQVINVFTITKYTGLDPELIGSGMNYLNNGNNPNYAAQSSFGIDYGNYPNNQRSFIVGVNLSF
jgi:TonB-linked SusC/RagA family outer membrane protein